MKKVWMSLAVALVVVSGARAGETVGIRDIDKLFEHFDSGTPSGWGSFSIGHPDSSEWAVLFAEDLSNADAAEGVWTVSEGEFTASKDSSIWTQREYRNFVLNLEFKTGEGANSGVLLYVTDTKNWIPNSVEIQLTDDFAETWASADPTWRCGAVFGRLAASKSMVKKPGEWNRCTITCKGPQIDVVLNGKHVTSMDMRKWDSPTHNPDGSEKPGWLNKPLSKHPTVGKIGLQGKHHGASIWFRNIRIMELED